MASMDREVRLWMKELWRLQAARLGKMPRWKCYTGGDHPEDQFSIEPPSGYVGDAPQQVEDAVKQDAEERRLRNAAVAAHDAQQAKLRQAAAQSAPGQPPAPQSAPASALVPGQPPAQPPAPPRAKPPGFPETQAEYLARLIAEAGLPPDETEEEFQRRAATFMALPRGYRYTRTGIVHDDDGLEVWPKDQPFPEKFRMPTPYAGQPEPQWPPGSPQALRLAALKSGQPQSAQTQPGANGANDSSTAPDSTERS
jgi:hypothetical protein